MPLLRRLEDPVQKGASDQYRATGTQCWAKGACCTHRLLSVSRISASTECACQCCFESWGMLGCRVHGRRLTGVLAVVLLDGRRRSRESCARRVRAGSVQGWLCRQCCGRLVLTASGKWQVLRARSVQGQRATSIAHLPRFKPSNPHGVVLRVVAQALGDDGIAEEEGEVGEDVLARGRDGAGRGEFLCVACHG